jgi:hypothetical protein
MRLFHYTCEHSAKLLGDHEAMLLPWIEIVGKHRVPGTWMPGYAVWLTDMARPERHALGLTNYLVTCDRTAMRYRVVDDSWCVRWPEFARGRLSSEQRDALELATPGLRPAHWWLSLEPVPAVFDPLP